MSGKDEKINESKQTQPINEGPNDVPVEPNQTGAEAILEQVQEIKNAPEYKELEDKYLRLAAEFDNYKKRMAREYSRVLETAADDFIRQSLEVVDDLERAISHNNSDMDSFRQGTELIYGKLIGLLKKRGLTQIETIGKHFDPVYHDAIMQIDRDDTDEGIIIEEIQKGYLINNRILRPARVIIARKKSDSAALPGEGAESGK